MRSETGVLVIGVNYNSTSDVVDFVRSIRNVSPPEQTRVVIADNSPKIDVALVEELKLSSGVEHRPMPHNPGYFGAASEVLADLYGCGEGFPEWVIVSNVDIVITSDDFFDRLHEEAFEEDVFAVGPQVISAEDGRDQNPFLRTRPSMLAVKTRLFLCRRPLLYRLWIFLNRVRYPLRVAWQRRRGSSPSTRENESIYAPHGALIALHQRYFEAGGDISTPLQLYGEEIHIGESVRALGGRVVYSRRLAVEHREHTSTSAVSLRRRAGLQGEAWAHLLEQYD